MTSYIKGITISNINGNVTHRTKGSSGTRINIDCESRCHGAN